VKSESKRKSGWEMCSQPLLYYYAVVLRLCRELAVQLGDFLLEAEPKHHGYGPGDCQSPGQECRPPLLCRFKATQDTLLPLVNFIEGQTEVCL
jgi:hypothetical protein